MRADILPVAALCALVVQAQGLPFRLSRVANTPLAAATEVVTAVVTIGDPVPGIESADRWTATVSGCGVASPLHPARVHLDPPTGVVTLAFPRGPFPQDLKKCHWQVTLQTATTPLIARQNPAATDAFSLGPSPQKPAVTSTSVTLTQQTPGIPLPGDVVNNKENWMVQVSDSKGNAKLLKGVAEPKYFKSQFVQLTFTPSDIAPIDPAKATYAVVFAGPQAVLASAAPTTTSGLLSAVKTKDDADLYFSGTYIAGEGTKPLWQIDAKGGYSNQLDKMPITNWFVGPDFARKHPTIRFGFYGTMQTNLSASTPNDRTRLDPDSLTAYSTFFGSAGPRRRQFNEPPKRLVPYLNWQIQPVGGEFSRKYPSSNIISEGRVTLDSVLAAERAWGFDLLPTVGFEGGKNLNRPGMLFGRPVDLHSYTGIARIRAGADANWFIYRRVPSSSSDSYVFVLSGSWVARVPFTREPFTTYAYLPDPQDATKITRQQTVAMRTNTRHYLQVDATWNITTLFGLQLEYKYGSLPPMFEFVSHQASLGLVFKGSYNHNNAVPSQPH